jgi:thioredoxin 1
MAESFLELTDSNFEAEVKDNPTPVIVDFWAPWCGPCKAIGPVLEALAESYNGQLRFAKCNVDDNPATPGQFGIRSIPTLLIFKDGSLVEQVVGLTTKTKLAEVIDTVLAGGGGASPFVMK